MPKSDEYYIAVKSPVVGMLYFTEQGNFVKRRAAAGHYSKAQAERLANAINVQYAGVYQAEVRPVKGNL